MDLHAYAQMQALDSLVKANGIYVPRCRGYRLMKDEEPVSQEKIDEMIRDQALQEAENIILIEDFPVCQSCWREFGPMTDRRKRRYLVMEKKENGWESPVAIRWDRLHGKVRKRLKFAIKRAAKRVRAQYNLWNQYAGREDVLYVHARLGSTSWTDEETKASVTRQPWCLAKVDDYWDTSYCDIYATIRTSEEK